MQTSLLCFQVALLLGMQAFLYTAAQAQDQPPLISIIIDDLGNRYKDGKRAIALPGAITYSILPHLPFSQRLAQQAHALDKEVMLHLPMEAKNGKALGPGGLRQCMDEQQFKKVVHKNFAAFPHIVGFNNHMGSWLTEKPRMMRWVMQAAMFRGDIYFVDSRTTSESVAIQQAHKRGIRPAQRDIFLDYEENPQTVTRQLAALVQRARKNGTAIAIGHPYKATLDVLENWLPTLASQGIRLVTVSELIQSRQERRSTVWQMSSSPSLKVAKNSKP